MLSTWSSGICLDPLSNRCGFYPRCDLVFQNDPRGGQHVDSACRLSIDSASRHPCYRLLLPSLPRSLAPSLAQASGSGGARLRPRSLWSTAQVARCQSYSSRATRSGLRLVRCGWYNDVDINLLRVHPSLPPTQCHVVWPTLHAWYFPTHAWYSPCSMLSHPTQSRTDGCAVCHWQRIDCATMSHLPRLLQPKAGRVGPVAVPMLPVGQEPGGPVARMDGATMSHLPSFCF